MDKLDCGHEPSEHAEFTTGYGVDAQGQKFCYACCAERDKAQMTQDGRIVLYLTFKQNNARGEQRTKGYMPCGSRSTDTWQITNWPGSLRFNAYVTTGKHNWGLKRYNVWFDGPDGYEWYGVTYGDNTQLCHCRRTKRYNRAIKMLAGITL